MTPLQVWNFSDWRTAVVLQTHEAVIVVPSKAGVTFTQSHLTNMCQVTLALTKDAFVGKVYPFNIVVHRSY